MLRHDPFAMSSFEFSSTTGQTCFRASLDAAMPSTDASHLLSHKTISRFSSMDGSLAIRRSISSTISFSMSWRFLFSSSRRTAVVSVWAGAGQVRWETHILAWDMRPAALSLGTILNEMSSESSLSRSTLDVRAMETSAGRRPMRMRFMPATQRIRLSSTRGTISPMVPMVNRSRYSDNLGSGKCSHTPLSLNALRKPIIR